MIGVVVATMAATLFGGGTISRALNIYDGNVWLWSSAGQSQRVNTNSGQVDMRYALTDAAGHDVEIIQTDKNLLLHDRTTGAITSVNLATLGTEGTLTTRPGNAVNLAMRGDTVILADPDAGTLGLLDPGTLTAKGDPLDLKPGFIPGGFDNGTHYWAAIPATGEVVSVVADAGSARLDIDRRFSVASPNHDLAVSVLDDGVAVVDRTDAVLIAVDHGGTSRVRDPALAAGEIAPRTTGDVLAVVLPKTRQVLLFKGGKLGTLTVPGAGSLGQTVVHRGRVYATDPANNRVVDLSITGEVKSTIPTSGATTMEQREDTLVINQPNSPTSYLINKAHRVTKVNKYATAATPDQPTKSNPSTDTDSDDPPKRTQPTERPSASPSKSAAPRQTPTPSPRQNTGPVSNPVSVPRISTPAFTNTAVPTDVRAAVVNDSDIRITWNPVAAPTGRTLQNYRVYICTTTCALLSSPTATSTILPNGENPERSTYFRVSSVIDGVESAASSRSNAISPDAGPQCTGEDELATPPRNFRILSAERGQVVVSWDPPADTRGNTITGYEIGVDTGAQYSVELGPETSRYTITDPAWFEPGRETRIWLLAVTTCAGNGATAEQFLTL